MRTLWSNPSEMMENCEKRKDTVDPYPEGVEILLSGIRARHWTLMFGKLNKQRSPPDADASSDHLPDLLVSRVATLVQEGALRRACAVLLQDPRSSPRMLRHLHPGSPIEACRHELSAQGRGTPGSDD